MFLFVKKQDAKLHLLIHFLFVQHELEASSKSSGDGIQTLEPTTESKQQSVAQLVYSDNRVSTL